MRLELDVTIHGDPKGQGSLTLWRGNDGTERAKHPPATVVHRNNAIATLVGAWGDRPALSGPIHLDVELRHRRPSSHYLPANKKRPEPQLRDDAPVWHDTTPDTDKLLRLIDDALVIAGVLADDKLVARVVLDDKWTDGAGFTRLMVYRLEESDS